ncbi:hypothetical protein MO973_10755 [Paenibacillus sp. TRM 82003]|nr:hypothetical protein [Paenibacillus sp. TRM 82003]
MNALTWSALTARFIATYKELQSYQALLAPFFTRPAKDEEAETLFWRMEEAVPVVRELVEALERHREWEGELYYPAAHAYGELALLPHMEALFDAAEEAEVMALLIGKAFLAKMAEQALPICPNRVREAQALLERTSEALKDFIRQEGELPLPAHL